MPLLDAALASRFASVALGHVTREYPNKLDHVLTGPEDVRGPRELHPVFFGSFDWHSCVHGWWTLFTLLRRFPDMPEAPASGPSRTSCSQRPTSPPRRPIWTGRGAGASSVPTAGPGC